MADGCFLKLCALDLQHHIIIAPLQHLNQNYHLLILQEIKASQVKVERIRLEQVLNLFGKLWHHSFVDMSVTSGVV